jgi:hypothetical protein
MSSRISGTSNTAMPPSMPAVAAPPSLASAAASKNLAEVERHLRSRDISPEALHNALEHACHDRTCPDVIKLVLLQHPNCDATGALQLAIQNDDVYLANQALRRGGIPERENVGKSSDRMRGVLTNFRRTKALYPPGAGQNNLSALDKALREGDLEAASQKLDWRMHNMGGRKMWSVAVERDKPDLQRAVLLLGKADHDRRFRLSEVPGSTVNDPAVRRIMKEIPQYSPTRGEPRNFNGTVDEDIHCVVFVEDLQATRAGDPTLKFDYGNYKDPETIAARFQAFPENLSERANNLMLHAPEVHLIDNRRLSSFLAAQLEAMEKNGEPARQILWSTSNHTMDLGLRIKNKGGNKLYVIKHFDPNRTTSHVRVALDSLEAVEALTLNQIIDGDRLIKLYWPEPKGLSLMTIRPPEDEIQAYALRPAGAVAGRTLSSLPAPEEVDGTAIWHMLSEGFSGNLRRLKDALASLPSAELSTLLGTPAGAELTPGLFFALQNENADVIRVFGEYLALVPENLRADLLACKRPDGVPGLAIALVLGNASAIEAFAECLPLVPENLRSDIVACKDGKGMPGLRHALVSGQKKSVLAYGKLLKAIPPLQRAPLLAAKDANKTGGLVGAMMNGHTDAVRAYGEVLLDCVPTAQFAEVLLAARTSDLFATEWTLNHGNIEAFNAFCAILQAAFSKALQAGDAAPVLALEKVLKELPPEKQAEIISATDGLATILNGLQA